MLRYRREGGKETRAAEPCGCVLRSYARLQRDDLNRRATVSVEAAVTTTEEALERQRQAAEKRRAALQARLAPEVEALEERQRAHDAQITAARERATQAILDTTAAYQEELDQTHAVEEAVREQEAAWAAWTLAGERKRLAEEARLKAVAVRERAAQVSGAVEQEVAALVRAWTRDTDGARRRIENLERRIARIPGDPS